MDNIHFESSSNYHYFATVFGIIFFFQKYEALLEITSVRIRPVFYYQSFYEKIQVLKKVTLNTIDNKKVSILTLNISMLVLSHSYISLLGRKEEIPFNLHSSLLSSDRAKDSVEYQ